MEEEGTAETTATETVKHLPTKDEHAFGTHLKEEHSREHRGKTTSTTVSYTHLTLPTSDLV